MSSLSTAGQTPPERNEKRWSRRLRQAFVHGAITIFALVVAFFVSAFFRELIEIGQFELDAGTGTAAAVELGLAALFIVLFNLAHVAWTNRQKARMAELAALVVACPPAEGTAMWQSHAGTGLAAPAEVDVLASSRLETGADGSIPLREAMEAAREIRIMLRNPAAASTGRRVNMLPREVVLRALARDSAASIAYIRSLRARGRSVVLKFYDQEIPWNISVLGDYVWVRASGSDCGGKRGARRNPQYVFQLDRDCPRRGLYAPFRDFFLEQWNDPRHPEYDLDADELVYRDGTGKEVTRISFGKCGEACPALLAPQAGMRDHAPDMPRAYANAR